jgi:PAS domain-containing protein
MNKSLKRRINKDPTLNKNKTPSAPCTIHHLAFDNTAQANIVSTVSNGKIIIVNDAACELFGYSKKELLTKNNAAILKTNERSNSNCNKKKRQIIFRPNYFCCFY